VQKLKNVVLRATTSLLPCDIEDTIVVTGSPRSGTTWLAELLRELPGYKMLNEPLNLNSSPLAQQVDNLDWRTYVPPGASRPELEGMLEKALSGRVGIPHMWRFQSESGPRRLLETITNRKVVVKLIRGGRMLPWVSERFPVRAFVTIVRHPCAVVASQINHPESWNNISPSSVDHIGAAFGGQLPDTIVDQFEVLLSRIESRAGHLAALWALDTYMTLEGPIRRPWITTTYEKLVRDSESEMKRLLEFIGEPMPEGIQSRFREPSNSAAVDLRTNDIEAQLSKWRTQLHKSQIQDVLRVVEGFELDDIYSESLYPNTEALRARVEQTRVEVAQSGSES